MICNYHSTASLCCQCRHYLRNSCVSGHYEIISDIYSHSEACMPLHCNVVIGGDFNVEFVEHDGESRASVGIAGGGQPPSCASLPVLGQSEINNPHRSQLHYRH